MRWPFRSRRELAPTARLGRRGEKLARKTLQRLGYKILAGNYRCPVGEADLIALDAGTRALLGAETLVFVEVKTRRPDQLASPQSAVNADKQRRLRRIADYYVRTHPAADLVIRFDVIAVVLPETGEPEIQHLQGAF